MLILLYNTILEIILYLTLDSLFFLSLHMKWKGRALVLRDKVGM